uniref:Uncharacterized protein n=1 Tax=Rhizophagus irregularis (strain DAOM 181602 / DAOM 197198 / MUCL 43194) TaxID=747089 RepID=U9UJE3_RHIID
MTNEKSLGPIIADRNMLKVKKILPNLSINMNLTYNGFISSISCFSTRNFQLKVDGLCHVPLEGHANSFPELGRGYILIIYVYIHRILLRSLFQFPDANISKIFFINETYI